MASYKKLKSGWQYRISYKDHEGKYRTKSKNGFRTKGEAQAEAEKVERYLNSDNLLSSEMTFGDYMQQWFDVYKLQKNSAAHDIEVQRVVDRVREYFKNTKLKDVTREKYQSFLNWFGEGRTTATVLKVHIYAKACLLDAQEEKHISHNPTYRITPKGTVAPKSSEDKFLSYDEILRVIEEVKRGIKPSWHSRYMILIAMSSGLRFSEILALNWDDIDFKACTINVNKSFDYRVNNEFRPPKTDSSYRVVKIDEETINILKEFKLGNHIRYKNNLFLEDTGLGYAHITNNAVNKSLKRACKRAGVPEITFHGLRHTHSSLLLYSGRDIKYISSRLGHGSVSVTYEVYAHIVQELEESEDKEATSFIGDLMKGNENAK